ncbi:MAG: cobaltochelatase subunit CobN [Lentisphaeria bacterium]|nr:cobaltochelatase subunit CobN [Lentisphaeria bacterium]
MKHFFAIFLILVTVFPHLTGAEKCALFLAGPSMAGEARRAFAGLKLPPGVRFRMIPDASNNALLQAEIARADLIIANGLVADFRKFLAESPGLEKKKIHLLGSPALRSRIPERLLAHCIFPMEPEVAAYRAYPSSANLRNMVLYLLRKELQIPLHVPAPEKGPQAGIIDPATGAVWQDAGAWFARHPLPPQFRGRVAVLIYGASGTPEKAVFLRPLVKAFADQGLEAVCFFGDEVHLIREFLLDRQGKARVDGVAAFSFKFKAGLSPVLQNALRDLDLPVVNALTLYRQTTAQWQDSPQGMNRFSVAFAMVAPEVSGLIEPTLLYGREMVQGEAVFIPNPGNMKRLAGRMAKWITLRRKVNSEKKVALFFYHPEGGKQDIGASYLNVPRSLTAIFKSLAENKYNTGGLEQFSEKAVTDRLTAGVRNVGQWAPGELEKLCRAGDVVRVPFARYREWFAALPEAFRQAVIREWGEPEEAQIMTKDGDFIIPVWQSGNLAILPEPMRGYAGDFQKMLHSKTLMPPHQYIAVYLWLRHTFRADAVIHLGRHGSQEWLPGKQLGLSENCAPAVLGGDMVNLYPYISDGIGEGILVKRRGGGVILAHLTPVLGEAGELPGLAPLADALKEWQSADPARKDAALQRVQELAAKSSWMQDAGIRDFSEDSLHQLQHYLEDLKSSSLPFGLHAFGISPGTPEIRRMTDLAGVSGKEREKMELLLQSAGRDEMDMLLRGLSGRFIPPGLSGDPVRTPAVLPAGRNFYGLDPDKFPTRDAYAKAGTAVENLIRQHQKNHNGAYPAQTAIVLWAGESVRTGGLNESILLRLIGMEPVWDTAGRVRTFRPVPGSRLGRPRLDAVVTASGAYRDQFAGLLAKLDRAQREAARLTDVENFLARHSAGIREDLIRKGVAPAAAEQAASCRIYTPEPGAYGVGVKRLAGASGMWEKNSEIAGSYFNRMRYGMNADGELRDAGESLSLQLKQTAIVLHSRSSTLYGVTDIDDMFQYMGGLALAVRTSQGRAPEQFIVDNRKSARVQVTPVRQFIASELRSRTLNPAWISAQQKENYAGARMIARMTDNLWGWQAVTPENVTSGQWQELYEVYQQDRYQLGVKEFFRQENAWAAQSVAARMLEAVRKEFWNAPQSIQTALARDYAQNVLDNGVACCDHTCNNPLLHQMVMNLISVPGVMTPEAVMQFKMAVEKAAARTLEAQIQEQRIRRAGALNPEQLAPRSSGKGQDTEIVQGYKMREARDEETKMSSSGIRWLSILTLTGLILLFLAGTCRRKQI